MAKRTGQLVIKQHQPLRHWLTMSAYVISLSAAGWGLYFLGQRSAGYDFSQLSDKLVATGDYARSLEEQKSKLSEQLAVLERGRQVEQTAFSDVDSSLKDLQQEILELKEEVAFYRGIVAPRESDGGLNIQSFKVEKTTEERVYRFKLVLTQVSKNDSLVKGRVKIDLAGIREGKPTKLTLSEVSGSSSPNLDLRFKYFQTVEGSMLLPVGFSPTDIEIEILPIGGRAGFSKSFNWESLLG